MNSRVVKLSEARKSYFCHLRFTGFLSMAQQARGEVLQVGLPGHIVRRGNVINVLWSYVVGECTVNSLDAKSSHSYIVGPVQYTHLCDHNLLSGATWSTCLSDSISVTAIATLAHTKWYLSSGLRTRRGVK